MELDQAVRSYLRSRTDLAESTRQQHRWHLRRFAIDVGLDRPVSRIRPANIEDWIAEHRWAPSTARLRLSLLKTFFGWCVARKLIKSDPTSSLRRPRIPRSVPRALRPPAISAVLRHCPDSRARLILFLMVQEGLRCVEVSRLELGDIDFAERLILVRGKGGHERVLPFSIETAGGIDAYLAEHPASSGPLIRSYSQPNRPVTPAYIGALVSKAMSAAGIKKRPYDGVSAHACRHTMATDLVRSGAHLRDVQNALGHTSLATTQRYLPWLVGDLREAMSGRSYR